MSKGIKRKRGAVSRIKYSEGLQVGSKVKCSDNSGAATLQIIGVMGRKGRLNRLPSATVGDMVSVTVKEGKLSLRKQVMRAIIIRQRKPYRRRNGMRIMFEDNAAILVNPDGSPIGSEIRGPVAKEVIERWPELSKLASMVV